MLFSADLILRDNKSTDPPTLTIDFTEIDKLLYLQTLEEGYSSEVTYIIRLNTKSGYFSFFNQKERITITIRKEAVKEYLTGMYIITSEESEHAYQKPEEFSRAFFSCNTEIPIKYFDSDKYFIEVMAIANLIKRPKPLSLLDPFLSAEKTVTGWIRLGN
jgi:hypothetical protein